MYPQQIDKFTEKLNKIDGHTYVIEEEVVLINGVYEGELNHDNVSSPSVRVYTGPKLTGNRIENFILSTPSSAPWKKVIKVFSDSSKVYITYETQGDTVEAEDINKLQESIVNTQWTINDEIRRATDSEKILNDNLNNETNRANNAEDNIVKNLNGECIRAKTNEDNLLNNINTEIKRAKTSESDITNNINKYKESNNAEIQALKAKDNNLENKKADKMYIDVELNKRYLKEQVYNKEEVLQKIKGIIGSAPEALDTLQELARALNNDADFAGTMTKQLSNKVDKVVGKQLSAEDYTSMEKNKLAGIQANANNYTHPSSHPAAMISEDASHRFVTDGEKSTWNSKANSTHMHSKSEIKDFPTKISAFENDKGYVTKDQIEKPNNGNPFSWNDLKGV